MNTKTDDLGLRIQGLRKKLKLSQTDLAEKIGISKSQMIRYESKGAQPTADVLNKLTGVLGTTADFLMNGSKDDKAIATLNDNELLQQFAEVDKMEPEDKETIKKLIDAFITKAKIKKMVL